MLCLTNHRQEEPPSYLKRVERVHEKRRSCDCMLQVAFCGFCTRVCSVRRLSSYDTTYPNCVLSSLVYLLSPEP